MNRQKAVKTVFLGLTFGETELYDKVQVLYF